MKFLLIISLVVMGIIAHCEGLSLKEALDMPEAHELDQIEADMDNSLAEILDNMLGSLLDIKGTLSKTLQDGLEKFLEYLQAKKIHLSDHLKILLTKISKRVNIQPLKDLIKKLLGSKNETNAIMPEHEAPMVSHICEELLKELTSNSTLNKIRHYLDNVSDGTTLEVVHEIKKLFDRFDNEKLRELIHIILSEERVSRRSISDFLQTVREILSAFKGKLQGKIQPLIDWLISKWTDIRAKIAEKIPIIKALAEEILKNSTSISATVAEEALSVFKHFQAELGTLYEPLMKRLRQLAGVTTTASPELLANVPNFQY